VSTIYHYQQLEIADGQALYILRHPIMSRHAALEKAEGNKITLVKKVRSPTNAQAIMEMQIIRI